MDQRSTTPVHPRLNRRSVLEAGAIGLLGLGMADVARRAAAADRTRVVPKKSVLFVFLTGGMSHQDTLDMKPAAPDTVRGEFRPISTRTPGIEICEHLPLLAQRTEQFAIVRSVGTNSAGHEEACHSLLSGRMDQPAGFNLTRIPSPTEWPSLAAQTTYAVAGRGSLPSAVVLPQPSVNEAGAVRPGQYAGRLGAQHEAWHLHVAAPCPLGNGACPHCFRFDGTPFEHASPTVFEMPSLTLPDGGRVRLRDRNGLLTEIEDQQRRLERSAAVEELDRHRQEAISVLAQPEVSAAFDVERAEPQTRERYGDNKFGLSLLMAYRLIAAGVPLVQVNLGKNSSWDTHRGNFVNLRDNLLPYLDRSVSALLDDLAESGLLESTLVIVTGEFGRTPKINADAGRDHWAEANSMLFAGGGVRGGNVLGATDKLAAFPTRDRQTPENFAATIYDALGIPRDAMWHDIDGRPYEFYRAEPIRGLM